MFQLKELAVLQEVGLLFSVDDDILKFDMDGILGLAFPGGESHSLLVNIFQRYQIEPVFSFYLRYDFCYTKIYVIMKKKRSYPFIEIPVMNKKKSCVKSQSKLS